MTGLRQFFILLLVVILPLGVAATVSYLEDPGPYDGETYEEGVARILLSGQNVGNIKNYDERLLQEILIREDRRRVDAIVLGSSRSMQIHNGTYTGGPGTGAVFLNHAVSQASLEDHIAILELYSERGSVPSTIIIGVDPWILNANNSQTRWKTLEPEYHRGLARIGESSVPSDRGLTEALPDLNRYTPLISSRVILRSFEQLAKNRTSYYPTDREELDVSVKLSDGSLSYPADERARTIAEIEADARAYVREEPVFGLGQFTRIDERYRDHFESTVRSLQSRNATVVLFLPPYHPIVYDTLSTDPRYSQVAEVESYLREFSSRAKITVVGSYDPQLSNLTSGDFYDASHPRREVVDRLFAGVERGGTGRASA